MLNNIDSLEMETRFLHDVQGHEMKVIRWDGVYRHLYFGKPETGTYHFELITWPGFLAITGDMGCYLFSRVEDMFTFFRNRDTKHNQQKGKTLSINPGYWEEKIRGADREGVREFSEERFRSKVKEHFDQVCEDMAGEDENGNPIPWADSQKAWSDIEEQLLSDMDELDNREAHRRLYEFQSEFIDFTDTWEWQLKEYAFHFGWCLHAIVWGIEKFDKRNDRLRGIVMGTALEGSHAG